MEPMTDAEVRLLLLAVVHGHAHPVDEELLERFVEWADNVRAKATIIDTILAGELMVSGVAQDDPEEFIFRRVTKEEREEYKAARKASDAIATSGEG